MKNKFLLLLLAGMSVFTACNDDDDKKGPKDLNGTFTTTDETNRLVLSYSDAALTGKTATFNSTDGRTATIELSGNQIVLGTMNIPTSGVIPGEKTTKLNVELIADGLGGYTFEGVDESNNRTLNYKGSIEEGKLTLNLNAVFSNELLGTWNLRPYDEWNQAPQPLRLIWETSTKFSVELFPGYSMEMTPGNLLSTVSTLTLFDGENVLQVMPKLLQNLSFHTDGNVVASYSDAENLSGEPVWQNSPLNMVHYVVKNERLYAYLNVEAIVELIMPMLGGSGEEGNTDMDIEGVLEEKLLAILLPKLPELLPMLSDGIPLGYAIEEDGSLAVYIDTELGSIIDEIAKELVSDAALMDMLKNMLANDPNFSSMAPMIEAVLTQAPQVFGTTTEMEIGLNLVKAMEAK